MKNITYTEKVKEGVNIEFEEYRGSAEDFNKSGEVVYDDGNRYPFGTVTIESPNEVTLIGWFIWDENYIYTCYEGYDKPIVDSVFDIEKRVSIESKDEREELYDAFIERLQKEKQLKKI